MQTRGNEVAVPTPQIVPHSREMGPSYSYSQKEKKKKQAENAMNETARARLPRAVESLVRPHGLSLSFVIIRF